MIDAGKFAKPTTPRPFPNGEERFFRFGISDTNAAAELRRLADAIDEKRVLIQQVQTGAVAGLDEYSLEAIMITFAEYQVVTIADRTGVALYGPSSPFPVEVTDA